MDSSTIVMMGAAATMLLAVYLASPPASQYGLHARAPSLLEFTQRMIAAITLAACKP